MPTFNDYPQSATDAAKRALRHREEKGNSCGTRVGWFRAKQIANREGLDEDEITRTYSFLSRAAVYDQGKYEDENGKILCGSIMYDAWGEPTMLPWAERMVNKLKEEKKNDNQMEKRSITFELRAKPESRTIAGVATLFNKAYDMGWYDEEMDRDVFVNSTMSDVVALFNHDPNMVLARTTSGTLQLNITDNGLEYEFEAPNTSLGNDILEMVRRGDIYQSSFAFTVEKEDWENMKDKKPKRIIRSINKVFDVSPVTYPANPDTKVAKRNFDNIQDVEDKGITIDLENRRKTLHLHNLTLNS